MNCRIFCCGVIRVHSSSRNASLTISGRNWAFAWTSILATSAGAAVIASWRNVFLLAWRRAKRCFSRFLPKSHGSTRGKRSHQSSIEKDLRMQIPTITAENKLSVVPDRAAVFVDGLFVGHVAKLGGSAERYWSHQENAKSPSVCPDTKLLRLKSTSLQIRNSRLRPTSSRAEFRQTLSRIRNS